MSTGDETPSTSPSTVASGAAADVPIASTTSDPPPAPASPFDAVKAALFAALNGGDPGENADLDLLFRDAEAQWPDDYTKFPENDANVANQFGSPDMLKAATELGPALAGTLAGALGGVVGGLTQIPQQAVQAGQSGLEAVMGAVKSAGDGGGPSDDGGGLDDSDLLGDGYGYTPGLLTASGSGGTTSGGGAGGATEPVGQLGPPFVPLGTFPAGAASTETPSARTAVAATEKPTTMGGMPMPMGGMGAGAGSAAAGKAADTKKVMPPVIRNGKPVEGRIVPNKLPRPVVHKTSEHKTPRRTTTASEGNPEK